MTFYVNGIKQDKIHDSEQDIAVHGGDEEQQTKTLPMELVFLTEDEALVKTILEKIHLIILSFGPYKGDLSTFGDLYAKVLWEEQTLEIRSPLTNLKMFCSNLFRLGLNVIDINSAVDPIDPETIQKLLASSSQEITTEHAVQTTKIQEKKNIEKKIYSDAKLNKSKEAADWLVSRIPVITQRTDRSLSFGELKQLRDLSEELKKLKMGNNYEKIKEAGNKLFRLIETLNERYYAGIRTKATLPIAGSIVTDVDIYRELDALDFAKQSRKIWISLSIEKNAYAFLGRIVIFFNLLTKDFQDMISRPISLLYRLYDIIWVSVLFTLCLAGFSIIINPLFQFVPSLFGVYYRMVSFGVLWAIIFILQYFRTKSILNLIMVYTLTFAIYYLFRYIITTNFAL